MMVQQWARPHLDQGCLVLHSYPLFNLTLFQDSKDGLDRSVGSFSLGPLVHLPSVATLNNFLHFIVNVAVLIGLWRRGSLFEH